MPGRIEQLIDDVSDGESLIRFAVAGQVARLLGNSTSATQGKIAKAVGLSAQNFTHALQKDDDKKLNNDNLRRLDEVIVSLAPELDRTGNLASFAGRLRGLEGAFDRSSLIARIPPAWTRRVLDAPAQDELQVLIQASTLLSTFLAANAAGRSSRTIRERYKTEIRGVVDRLILVAGAPPTPSNLEAQILLGGLARFAHDITWERLENALVDSPLGFRVWRPITKLVVIGKDDIYIGPALRTNIRRLLARAEKLREDSIYPGRSLDLELAIAVPAAWSPADDDWAGLALLRRAENPGATLRERATAAMGLWQRAHVAGRQTDPEIRAQLTKLIELLGSEETKLQRPDIASGLSWVATTLDKLVTSGDRLVNSWEPLDEPWFRLVHDAARETQSDNVPSHLRSGTRTLFLHLLLQNAGVYRRQAIDTLIAGSWTEPVVRGLSAVLDDEEAEAFIRIRALFGLGFLQHRSTIVARSLRLACGHAYRKYVSESPEWTRATVTELHAALFAVGDAYGAEDARNDMREVRDSIKDVLVGLVTGRQTDDPRCWTVARALVYLLTFTAQPRTDPATPDLSEELLRVLSEHPDGVTGRFSRWALSARIVDGSVRPLLFAVARSGDEPAG